MSTHNIRFSGEIRKISRILWLKKHALSRALDLIQSPTLYGFIKYDMLIMGYDFK